MVYGLCLFCLHSTICWQVLDVFVFTVSLIVRAAPSPAFPPGARGKGSNKVCLVFGSHSGSPWKLNFPTLTPEQNSEHLFWLHLMEVGKVSYEQPEEKACYFQKVSMTMFSSYLQAVCVLIHGKGGEWKSVLKKDFSWLLSETIKGRSRQHILICSSLKVLPCLALHSWPQLCQARKGVMNTWSGDPKLLFQEADGPLSGISLTLKNIQSGVM